MAISHTTEEYEQHQQARADYSKQVLSSSSNKRLVMAGPGTGKSFLFQQLAKNLRGQGKDKILVLTFINELVKDLAIDMHGLAEVSTLHSFAAKKLRSRQSIYLDLLSVVSNDYKIEGSGDVKFPPILNNLEISEHESELEYLSKRRQYYEAYDATTIVYDLVNSYQADSNKIPTYDLIMIDEYQDFNELESALIELLSTKSPVLIAGDDDQSLYSFKHSKPENIRTMHANDDYETFELPYCSRSTKVVIDAFHDFLTSAQSNGHLNGRVSKQYLYFPDAKKDKYSNTYPAIEIRKEIYESKNAYMIDQSIKSIFEFEPEFDVLIICPLKKQIPKIAEALRKKGYTNVSGDEKIGVIKRLLAEGLHLLFENKDSNLGWRLCAEALLDEGVFEDAVNKSADLQTAFKDCLPRDAVTLINKLRAISVKLRDGTEINAQDQELIFKKLGIQPDKLGEVFAKDIIFGSALSGDLHCSFKIKITTILGSKGLSYDYVFMVNFDDRYLLTQDGSQVDDESINKFLVALTRSRKKISIYTSKTTEPTFVAWINDDRKLVL